MNPNEGILWRDPVHGNPDEVVDEIVRILERLVDVWT